MNALILLTMTTAAPPQAPLPPQAPPLEVRVTALEARVTALESKKVTATMPTPTSIPTPVQSPPIVSGPVRTEQYFVPGVGMRTITVVPSGMHAHTTTDGQTIVHGNENYGNAAAHTGIVRPWIRTAEAGQPIPTTPVRSFVGGFRSQVYSSGCPTGGCPNR